MTLLVTYSPYLSSQLCEVTGKDLPSTEYIYCTSCLRQSDLPTLISLVSFLERDTTRKGRVYKHYKYHVQNTQNSIFRGAATQSYLAIRRVKRRVDNQSIAMVTAGGIICPYLWLPLVG